MLPGLVQPAIAMKTRFTDSSHQLWQCETTHGAMVLKICHQARVQQSDFWLGMNTLFLLDFPQSLNTTQQTSRFLQTAGCFQVPEIIAEQAGHFVLVRFIAGTDLDATQIADTQLEQLAHHIGKLHQQTTTNWGTLSAPQLRAGQWPERLEITLRTLAERTGFFVPEVLLQHALAEAKRIQATQFVPIMPDLRWDQLRKTPGGQIALLDLDAFVRAPRELELVLLEYLLTQPHAMIFADIYRQYCDWPDLSACRHSYRVLLFLMCVLGESDLQKWLVHPAPFNDD